MIHGRFGSASRAVRIGNDNMRILGVQFGIYVDAGYPTDLHWLDIPQETLILGLSAGGLKN
jgi:hypothetical protein